MPTHGPNQKQLYYDEKPNAERWKSHPKPRYLNCDKKSSMSSSGATAPPFPMKRAGPSPSLQVIARLSLENGMP